MDIEWIYNVYPNEPRMVYNISTNKSTYPQLIYKWRLSTNRFKNELIRISTNYNIVLMDLHLVKVSANWQRMDLQYIYECIYKCKNFLQKKYVHISTNIPTMNIQCIYNIFTNGFKDKAGINLHLFYLWINI